MKEKAHRKRVLIGKPGLDGHDRGAKFIAQALRDAGFEVVYTGIRRSPEEIAAAAVQEDVGAVGLSSLSGAHMRLFPAVVEALKKAGAPDIPVLGGGVIPEEDIAVLKEAGIVEIFTPGTPIDRQVILIGNRELQRLLNRISTGEEFVIRILSAANYITGESCVVDGQEPCIQIFVDASPNQLVYKPGERLATIALDSPPFRDREIVERFNLLMVATQFRAQQDGVAVDDVVVADNSTEALVTFLQAIQSYGRPLDIQAIAARDIYTIGPVNIGLVASEEDRILFWTNNLTLDREDRDGAPSAPNELPP